MPDFQSLYTDEPETESVPPPNGPVGSGEWQAVDDASLTDPDPRFEQFRDAWRNGAGIGDLFGPAPFALASEVGPNGVNRRPDVAKVETFLDRTGDFDASATEGPTGYHSLRLDDAMRGYQGRRGLTVDGRFTPGGESITALTNDLVDRTGPAPFDTSQLRNALPNPDFVIPGGESITALTNDLVDRTRPAPFGAFEDGKAPTPPDLVTPVGYSDLAPPSDRNQTGTPRAPQIAEALRPSTAGANQPTHREAERHSAVELDKLRHEVARIDQKTRRLLRDAERASVASTGLRSLPGGSVVPRIHVPKSIAAMRHYLDGKGGVVHYDPKWMLESERLRNSAERNEGHFVNWMLGKFARANEPTAAELRIKSRLEAMKPGETFRDGTKYQARYGFDPNLDRYSDQRNLLINGFIFGNGAFTFSRKGNMIEVRGVVEQKISDPFDWTPGRVRRFSPLERHTIRHDDMIFLSKYGKARVFEVRSVWRRQFVGRLRIQPDPATGRNRIIGFEELRWSDAK